MGQHDVRRCTCDVCTRMRKKYKIPLEVEKEHPDNCSCQQCCERDEAEGHAALRLMEHIKRIRAKYPGSSGSRVVIQSSVSDMDTIVINGKVYTGPKKRCSCGKANTKDAKFCSNCGTRFSN